MRLAVLDDYQGFAATFQGWRRVPDLSVVPFRDHVHDSQELVARLQGFDAVMRIRERTPLTRPVLEKLDHLKLVLATGMRNARSIDLKAADELKLVVCVTDALHQTTTELTWALILALFRNLPQQIASVRAGGWQVGLGRGLSGRTMGIVGLGNMGIPVARIAQLFGMKVTAWSPHLTPERAASHGVQYVSKAELFSQSSVVTIHMPLSDSTAGLVTAEDIGRINRHAYLINTSRPEILDEQALIAALHGNRIGGAGLDVFGIEPLPLDHPFRTLHNVVATPHIGFVIEENYDKFFTESTENLAAFLAGKPIRTITATRPYVENSDLARQMHREV